MTPALTISTSALGADNTAIETVAQNIANAQTPGYAAETAALATAPSYSGVGDGVEVVGIEQATNTLLTAAVLRAQGELSASTTLQDVLTTAESLFPLGAGTTTTGTPQGTAIAGALSNFWNSWDSLAQDPSTAAARTTTIAYAQSLAEGLNQASASLAQIATNTRAELSTTISRVNALLTRAASINSQILKAPATPTNDTNQLQDELRQVASTLADMVGISLQIQPNGTGTISIGGSDLVSDTTASTLVVERSLDTPTKTVIANATSGFALSVAGGSAGGLLSALNYYLPTYSADLDNMAIALKTAVNSQLTAGYTATGTPAATVKAPTPLPTGQVTLSVNTLLTFSVTVNGNKQAFTITFTATPTTGTTYTITQIVTRINATAGDYVTASVVATKLTPTIKFLQLVALTHRVTVSLTVTKATAFGFTATPVPATGSRTTHTLFTGTDAANIKVSSAIAGDPSLLALSSTTTPFNALNNGGNAQRIATLGTASTGADAQYRSLIQNIGIDTANAYTQASQATALLTQAQASIQVATGVDVTEQLTQLIVDQQAYEAAAKMLSIASQTIDSLLEVV